MVQSGRANSRQCIPILNDERYGFGEVAFLAAFFARPGFANHFFSKSRHSGGL